MAREAVMVPSRLVVNASNKIRDEIRELRDQYVLGVFNDRLPVLMKLSMPRPKHFLFPHLFREESFRVHFEDIDGEWWISTSKLERLFTFYLPIELLKLLANEKPIDVKAAHMSTLTYTLKDENFFGTIKMHLDPNWVNEVRRSLEDG